MGDEGWVDIYDAVSVLRQQSYMTLNCKNFSHTYDNRFVSGHSYVEMQELQHYCIFCKEYFQIIMYRFFFYIPCRFYFLDDVRTFTRVIIRANDQTIIIHKRFLSIRQKVLKNGHFRVLETTQRIKKLHYFLLYFKNPTFISCIIVCFIEIFCV